ncbi:MAG: macro domain-containing protein [Firmicutes bacterium]|nr:macro domain-containing protein [Bacillota bacterium]
MIRVLIGAGEIVLLESREADPDQARGLVVECTLGDIARQGDCDAVVNAANAWLRPGSGVAGALHKAAGPELAQECLPLAPIRPGEGVITKGYRLPNRYVIHCLGPVYGQDHPAEELLASCYVNSLQLAEEYRCRSIAFPAISTGIFGYPMEEGARVALQRVVSQAPRLQAVKKIRFVLYDHSAFEVHAQVLEQLAKKGKFSSKPKSLQ